MAGQVPGTPHLVEAPGHMFSDAPEKFVSLLNLASIRDLERVVQAPVDPRRFRANLLLAGLDPWTEMHWIGRTLEVGAARLEVVSAIDRCAATNVDPATGSRDLNIPLALRKGYGHTECGLYARVVDGGRVAVGDGLRLL